LIVAAGRGERLGEDRPKAFVTLAGRPMVEWSVEALQAVGSVERIVVALPEGEDAPAGTIGVPGGAVRSESVRAALREAGDVELVVVHDAARPLARPELFDAVLQTLEADGCDAAIAAARVSDTIKEAGHDGVVRATLDRSVLWAIQTPQAFRRDVLERALDVDDETLAAATDDAWLVERAGGTVRVVEALVDNRKVTTSADLRFADLLLRQRCNLAVVREILTAVNEGRMEDPFAHYHEDVVWDTSRLDTAGAGWSHGLGWSHGVGDKAVAHGHEGLREVWRSWLSAWETVHFEADELFTVGDHVVQFQRQLVRGRQSGIELEMPTYVQVWSFRGDKIAAMRFFADSDEAMRFVEEN
jgi:2-C-methyl-D-erythritol 4-phosphate cytidylyltransferase